MSRERARRRRLLLGGSILAATAALGGHLGWYSGPLPWQLATGWREIPLALRPPVETRPWREEDPRRQPEIHWLGHAGFLLEWRGSRLLIDPNLSRWCTVARRRLAVGATPADLGPIDAALISHSHFDHLDLPTLRGLPRLTRVIVPAGGEGYAEPARLRMTVRGLEPGESWRVGELEITAVPAAHGGNRWHPLEGGKAAVGYVVRAPGGDAVYYAGDTGFDNDFAAIGATHRPRLAILPIGAYSPRVPIGRVHLNPEQAAEAAVALGAEVVMPAHFGTFTLSLDRASSALPRFARAARQRGVRWIMPRLLDTPRSPAD